MKKLTLNLEALQVESFETKETAQERGTVRANAPVPTGLQCEQPTFEGPTCHGEGGFTCEYHCTWWPGTACEEQTNDVEIC